MDEDELREYEEDARKHGIPYMLDRMGLDGIGNDQLDILLDQEIQLINAADVEGIGEGHLEGGAVQGDGEALVEVGGLGGNEPDHVRGDIALADRHDGGADLVGDGLEDGINVHDAKVLEDLDRGLAGALELAQHLLVLEIVYEPLILDQRQQGI